MVPTHQIDFTPTLFSLKYIMIRDARALFHAYINTCVYSLRKPSILKSVFVFQCFNGSFSECHMFQLRIFVTAIKTSKTKY